MGHPVRLLTMALFTRVWLVAPLAVAAADPLFSPGQDRLAGAKVRRPSA
jgi:hypothetical protein